MNEEILRLALELDPIVGSENDAFGNGNSSLLVTLDEVVGVLGWDEAQMMIPKISGFLDRLAAMVDEHVENEGVIRVLRRQRDEAQARIEKALALCNLIDNPDGTSHLANAFRAALTGESGEVR